MNKVLIRSLLLFIIITLVLLVIYINRSPFGKSNSSFASEPKEDITRIELSGEGKKLVLEKKGEAWFVNDKSEARKSGVLFLIRILKELKIKSPVSAELYAEEISGKNLSPVKVKVYENRKLLNTILVYKTHSNVYGNVMKTKESSKPFIVYVPGFEGDIGSGFILNELFWEPYTVFNLLPSEIAAIKFENLNDTVSSFTIIKKDNSFVLSGNADDKPGINSSRILRYVSYFAFIPFESWALNLDRNEKSTIESSPPLYRITVTTATSKLKILTLWGMQTVQNGIKGIDSDRLLGKTDDKNDLFIMRYFDIDPLLKKRAYFFQE
jgi:hypothetical protein